jgi:Predicted Zn-dependent protease (DUF2268).
MKIKHFSLIIISLLLTACSDRMAYGDVNPQYEIVRFDKVLYDYLNGEDLSEIPEAYLPFLNELGEKVLRIGGIDSAGFYERLRNYYLNPALMELYAEEQSIFNDIEDINKELSQGMERFIGYFPDIEPPQIYMHVSGLLQNVIVTEEFLSLSADKYLGSDYLLYQEYFEDYRLQGMTPERIAPDFLLGFMMANLDFEGDESVLLDRMLYEGKLRYILSKLIPKKKEWEYVGYNKEQNDWCKKHEKLIWHRILEQNQLFTSDFAVTNQYMREAPYTTTLPAESPGRAGVWLGYQIIKSYIKKNPKTTIPQLMELTDYQTLLKDSKYKP